MKHRTKSKLSKKQKSQLNNLRKWVVKERRRLRLPNELSSVIVRIVIQIKSNFVIPYHTKMDLMKKANQMLKGNKKRNIPSIH